MAFARTILAILIAASVALLPAAAGAAFNLKFQEGTEMSASGPAHDCRPPAANPCDKSMDGCTSMATCALKCFGHTGGVSSPLAYPALVEDRLPVFERGNVDPQSASPPFRPPRA